MDADRRPASAEHDSRRSAWWRFVLLVLIGAALVRAVIIVVAPHGGFDLQIYTYFGRLVNSGANPYTAPASGAIDPVYADNPIGELGFFAGILRLHDSATTIRVVFLLADLASICVAAFLFRRPCWWRKQVVVLLAFNPFLLVGDTVYAEDKTVLGLVVIVILLALERHADAAGWVATTALGVLKWISAYFLLPLMLFTGARRGVGYAVAIACAGIGAFVLSSVPFFSDSVVVPFGHRNGRAKFVPEHASLMRILVELGLYRRALPTVLAVLSVAVIYGLFLRSRIDIREAVVLSVAASLIFLPDGTRAEFILVPFLFVLRLCPRRLAAIWAFSVIAVLPTVINSAWFATEARAGRPLARSLIDLVGGEGSLQSVLLTNSVLILVIALYGWDRLHGRVDIAEARRLRLAHVTP